MIRLGLRYLALTLLLGLLAWVLPGLHIPWPDVWLLPAVLMALDGALRWILGQSVSPKGRGFLGWALAVIFFKAAGLLLAHVTVGIPQAFLVGTVLWLTGWIGTGILS